MGLAIELMSMGGTDGSVLGRAPLLELLGHSFWLGAAHWEQNTSKLPEP